MTRRSRGAAFARAFVLAVVCASDLAADSASRKPDKRQLVNAREVYRELKLSPETEKAVPRFFYSFRDYQELMLYHPKFGYYSSGRVSFVDDFQTYPVLLAPYFGEMVAQQIFRMWEGMRQSGTLGANERFMIAEFGAGNGVLAESILDYAGQRAREDPDGRWRELMSQLIYVCYDRAPALREAQLRRNARFGGAFEARDGDATDMARTIPPGSLQGVIVSNEMLDVFGVEKTIVSESGTAEAAFVVPSLPRRTWSQLQSRLPPALQQMVTGGNTMIRTALLADEPNSEIYLNRQSFVAFLEWTAEWKDYVAAARAIQFQELYVPARVVPGLAEHLQRYASAYAAEVARSGKGVVTYINLGEEKFIRDAAQALKAGYVITVDYGSNWDGIMATTLPHMRTYGPGNLELAPNQLLAGLAAARGTGSPDTAVTPDASGRGNPDPYRSPSLNDITTDVNFSYLAEEGELAGLKPAYFGPQRALQTGTSTSANSKSASIQVSNRERQLDAWRDFETDRTFKLLVQQKRGTDDSYAYPDPHSERIEVNETSLTAAQRKRAAAIEQKLRAQ